MIAVDAEERRARAALSLHAAPGAAQVRALAELGAAGTWQRELTRRRSLGLPVTDVGDVLAAGAGTGIRFAVPGDEEWPTGLATLRSYVRGPATADERTAGRDLGEPFGLWVRGGALATAAAGVAVVGSRACSSYGLAVAMDLGIGLVERGYDVVSGAAYGIDGAAHRGALAGGGRTLAVLACGVDVAYPLAHATLLDVLAREGVVVSEVPPGERPGRGAFLRRNRVIAALTAGTVLVEAGLRSGARNTVGHARALGRARLVVPGPVTASTSAGCHATLRGDPEARLVTSAADVVEEVGRIGVDLAPLARGPHDPRDALGALARDVLELLPPYAPQSVGELAGALSATVADVLAVSSALELAGLVELADGEVRLTALGRRPTHRAG